MFKGVYNKDGNILINWLTDAKVEPVLQISDGNVTCNIESLRRKYGEAFVAQLNDYVINVRTAQAKAKVQNLGITFCESCGCVLINEPEVYMPVPNRGSIPLCKTCAKAEKEKTYKMYLKNDLIPDVKFEIAENTIKVSSPSTIFVQMCREPEYAQKDCLGIYSQILGLAKEKGAKISYKLSSKKKLLNLWSDYTTDTSEINFIYSSVVEVLKKVQANGIHYGVVDDIVLKKAQDLQNAFNTRRLESAISKVHTIVSFWQNTLVDLQHFNPKSGSFTICL